MYTKSANKSGTIWYMYEWLIGLIKYFPLKIEGKDIRVKYIQKHGLKLTQIKPQHLPLK